MVVLQGGTYPAELVSGADLTGATVTCAVSAPDLTTVTYTTSTGVTVTGSTATVSIPATQVGQYLLLWNVTGTVSGMQEDQFTVKAAKRELMSIGDLRDELNIADTSKDEKLRRWLTAAGDVIENVTGPLRATTRTERFDGGTEWVVLSARWVSAVTSVVETWATVNYTLTEQPLGASTDAFGYTWDPNTNTITRRTYGGAAAYFQPGLRTVAVTYLEGLTSVPDDVQLACARLIGHWYRKSETAFRGTSFGGGSDDAVNMPGNYMVPNEVMELLEPWRRPPGIF